MDLRLRTRPFSAQTERVMVVEVAGELDLHSAPQLRAEVGRALENNVPRIVIDLAGVTFLDSTGVGVLVGALKRARAATGALNFCGAQPRVRRVFEITGLLGALPLFDTRDQACAALEIQADLAPENAASAAAQPMAQNSSNGAPLDGAPLDGAPLDGAPLDGAPMNGVPMNGAMIAGGELQ